MKGFTLIEFLVAFAVAALVIVPVLALLYSSFQLVHASEDLVVAAQAAGAASLDEKTLGARVRPISSEEIELGPLRIRSEAAEIIPTGRLDGVRVRLYK